MTTIFKGIHLFWILRDCMMACDSQQFCNFSRFSFLRLVGGLLVLQMILILLFFLNNIFVVVADRKKKGKKFQVRD